MKNFKFLNMVISAMCVAAGVVLPLAFHSIPNGGQIFLPMHIPVLLCGLLCGPWYGLACGILTPSLSSLITSMPPVAFLPSILCELAVYGFIAGIFRRAVKSKNRQANLFISLIAAMLCGRVVSGILNALIFSAGKYSMQLWLTASFVKALPGIAIQLIVIPVLMIALQKAGLAESFCTASRAARKTKAKEPGEPAV